MNRVTKHLHYDPPIPFEKFTPAVSRTGEMTRKVDSMTDYDTSRGPWHAMLDKQALALQAQIGGSYASAFTKVYEDPSSRSILDQARYEHIAKSHDVMFGTGLSSIPVQKSAPYDPLAKSAELAEIRGPNHAKLHSMAVDHQRANPGMSYQSAYGYLYSKPENVSLRNAIKSEHLASAMSAHADGDLDKAAAPPDALQDDIDPASAEHELHQLVDTPGMSYARAFTHEYLAAENRSLKERVTDEGILRMQAMAPSKPFPAYTSPGHTERNTVNIGYSGKKPRNYAGG
jgi:hypothetical protein